MEGITVAGKKIPQGTTIVAPRYNIGRRQSIRLNFLLRMLTSFVVESCFVRAGEFLPERWSSRPELIKDASAFAPFNQGKDVAVIRLFMNSLGLMHTCRPLTFLAGRYSCVGKQLALTELRLVTATLVSKYSIRFAIKDGGASVMNDMRDYFTARPGQLDLIFERL